MRMLCMDWPMPRSQRRVNRREEEKNRMRLADVFAKASPATRTHSDLDEKKIFGWDLSVLRLQFDCYCRTRATPSELLAVG